MSQNAKRTLLSQTVAAELCGVTIATMINWGKQENPPPQDPITRRYPADELGEWIRQIQPNKRGRGGGTPFAQNLPTGNKNEEETRLKKLQADKLQIELDQMAGELVLASEVSEAWTTIMQRVKTRLLKLPTAVARLVHMEPNVYVVEQRISDGVREALEQLSTGNDDE